MQSVFQRQVTSTESSAAYKGRGDHGEAINRFDGSTSPVKTRQCLHLYRCRCIFQVVENFRNLKQGGSHRCRSFGGEDVLSDGDSTVDIE